MQLYSAHLTSFLACVVDSQHFKHISSSSSKQRVFCLMIRHILSGSSWTLCRTIVFLGITWKFVLLANGDFSGDCWILSHYKLGSFLTLLISLINSTDTEKDTEKGGNVTLLFPLIVYSMLCPLLMNSVGLSIEDRYDSCGGIKV